MSCTSAKVCIAVGNNFLLSALRYVTLAEARRGNTWTIDVTPNPAHPEDSQLNGLQDVSCSAASACTAVGSFASSAGDLTLVEVWNGKKWTVEATPDPQGAEFGGLDGVSCTSTRACTAVGSYENRAGKELSLAEAWNGKGWAIETTPTPSRTFSHLSGVSCTSANSCTAVGSYTDGAGAVRTLGEVWNGKKWAIDRTSNPSGTRSAQLYGVSCTSAEACTAVGNYDDSAGTPHTLAETWNGKKWAIDRTPNPKGGAVLIELSGVSCSSAKACTAVGDYWPTAYSEVTLGEIWKGTTWSIERTPNPGHAVSSDLSGVSCTSAAACTAVGNYGTITDRTLTLGEAWNGKTWAIEGTPDP